MGRKCYIWTDPGRKVSSPSLFSTLAFALYKCSKWLYASELKVTLQFHVQDSCGLHVSRQRARAGNLCLRHIKTNVCVEGIK